LIKKSFYIRVGAALILSLFFFSSSGQAKSYTKKYDRYFRKYSKRYFSAGFDWKWFKAQAIAESQLKKTAESGKSAKGIMQLLPSTFSYIKEKNPELKSIFDPRWNIAAGIYYDSTLWEFWSSDRPFTDRLNFMFASYNAGKGRILKAQRLAKQRGKNTQKWASIAAVSPFVKAWRQQETLSYLKKIDNYKKNLSKAQPSPWRIFSLLSK